MDFRALSSSIYNIKHTQHNLSLLQYFSLFLTMTFYSWNSPLRCKYKVNVHVIHTACQFNGNSNGIGIIIRDHRGRMVMGLTGSMRGLSTLATQL